MDRRARARAATAVDRNGSVYDTILASILPGIDATVVQVVAGVAAIVLA